MSNSTVFAHSVLHRLLAVFVFASLITLVMYRNADAATLVVDPDACAPPSTNYCTIQAAIDAAAAGDTINVVAGTYVEQPLITKNLTLAGAGSATIIKAPATLTVRFTTSAPQYSVLAVVGANATVRDLVIDGDGRGNSANKFSGIGYFNAGGAIISTEIKGVRDTPFSGSQHGVALYAYLMDGSTRNLVVRNNYIHDFQKNAMAINSGDSSVLTVQIVGNRVEGVGATTTTAQNGIQVYRASGTLDGYIDSNFVTGIAYDNTLATTKWVATSILNWDADVDVSNNIVTNGHVGVYNYDAQGAIANNRIDIVKVGVYAWGIIATDPPYAVPSPYEAPIIEGGAGADEGLAGAASATEMAVNVSGNVVTFTGPDNTATYGIEGDAGYGPRSVRITADHNNVTGFEVGLEFYQCQGGTCQSTVFTGIAANYNNLAGNTIGMRSNASYLTANGENNWWGAASGPSSVGTGTGAQVSQYIDYDPWLNAPVATVLSIPATPIVLQRTAPKIINVPVLLAPLAGDQIASAAFSVDYDQTCLSTTAAKVTGLPVGFQNTVAFDATDTDGELDVSIWSNAAPPAALPAGALLSVEFTVLDGCWGTDRTVDVLFSNQPAPSFGSPAGQTLFRSSAGASIPLDFNSSPTDITLSAVSVAENAPVGTVVGAFSNDDPDVDGFTYSLVSGVGGEDNAAFTIVGNELRTATTFDFETQSVYHILVKLDDGKGGVVTKAFTITITNVNDAPTDIALSNHKVFEAALANSVVGIFSTTDQDTGDAFTYALVAGAGDTDNAAFTISGSQLLINASPDFDAQASYTIRVRSTDTGVLSIEKQFTIQVIDRSELSLPGELDLIWVAYSGNVQAPIRFLTKGNAVRSAAFSVDYNEACLTFTGLSNFQSGWSGSTVAGSGGVLAIALNGTTNLAGGVVAMLNFSANDACASGTVSPVIFTGATTLNDAGNQPLPVLTTGGALHIVANDARGDCNSDDLVNAADFVAEVLESFDANIAPPPLLVNHWLYVHTGSFVGSAIGCDANTSAHVDVADILCTVLVVFGDNSCTLPAIAAAAPQPAILTVTGGQTVAAGETVEIPISLRGNGEAIAGAAFRINFDAQQVAVNPTDANHDGIPDAIRFNVPVDLMRSVKVGEDGASIDIAVADLSLPLFELPDNVLVKVAVTVKPSGAAIPLQIGLNNASLGNTNGMNVPVDVEVVGQAMESRLYLPVLRR